MSSRYPIRHHVIRHSYSDQWEERHDRESYLYITKTGAIEGWRTRSALESVPGYIGGIEVHSPQPRYDSHKPVDRHCQWVRGGVCYTDGSSLAFDKIRDVFDSPRWVFAELEDWAKHYLV